MVDPHLAKPRSRWASVKQLKKPWLSLAVATVIGLVVTSVMFSPTSPPDLSTGHRMLSSGLISSWRDGDLIVLIRHEERCDRSSNPCLGPADGLTIAGTVAATTVGKAFQTLGMANSDVLSSTATRTAQTALFMFSKTGLLPNPLAICGNAMAEKLIAHKADGRNLLLVTHSTCISGDRAWLPTRC